MLRRDCKLLHLPMQRHWFNLVASGEKGQEYRLVSPHWRARIEPLLTTPLEKHIVVCFRNGYSKSSPIHYRVLTGVDIRKGALHPEWGEDGYFGKEHYVLSLGDKVEFED